MNAVLEREIDTYIEENRGGIIADIAALVAIPSISGEGDADAPFGAFSKQALEKGLEIAGRMGLKTQNCANRMGWAEVPGQSGQKYLATVTHVDVVPAGTGWTGEPFTLREKDGYIIGRGVMDDKGPSVLCLYALKFFADKKIPLHYTLRALLGTAEETGMEDVKWFLENYPAPAFAFSPDADFPVCNGEKGIYQAKFTSKAVCQKIVDIFGGTVVNAVPDTATALVQADPAQLKGNERIDISAENGMARITARGVAGHASHPENTVNAIGVLVNYILDNGLAGEGERDFLEFMKTLHASTDGSSVGIKSADDKFGALTCVGGMAGCDGGHLWQTVDCRYPTGIDGKTITEKILAASKGTAVGDVLSDNVPFYIDADTPTIRACVDAYNEVTREGKEPFTIGGGTYARDFPFAVSFGPEHSDRPYPEFAGGIHSADEAARVSDFMEALKIYILAILKLQDVEL